jgi:hypothetical protein
MSSPRMENPFLTGDKDNFFTKMPIRFWEDGQDVVKKGAQIRSIFSLDKMYRSIVFILAFDIC